MKVSKFRRPFYLSLLVFLFVFQSVPGLAFDHRADPASIADSTDVGAQQSAIEHLLHGLTFQDKVSVNESDCSDSCGDDFELECLSLPLVRHAKTGQVSLNDPAETPWNRARNFHPTRAPPLN
ncbi:MAG: hypothetical protein R3F50_07365 [Gammaproteobacteria bacterium]